MKSILLTTTALVAFAGAAVADGHTGVSFGGDAALGYNDTTGGDYDGFYWDSTLNVGYAQDLDNGVTAGVKFNIDIQEDGTAQGTTGGNTNLNADDWQVFLKTDAATLTYGDTGTAANSLWSAAGDMESDGFTSDWTDAPASAAVVGVLRLDATVGTVSASVSGIMSNATGTSELDQTSIAVKADVAGATVAVAYEEATTLVEAGDFNNDEIFGLSVGFAAAGANFTVAYAEDEDSNSTGVKASMPVGAVTVTGYYVDESVGDANYGINAKYAADALTVALDYQDDQGVTKVGIDGTYDLGNGLTVLAGMYDQSDDTTAANNGTDTYVAASYDLGGGAALLVSYTDAETAGAIADDEVGGPDYQVGTTVVATFKF